MQAIVARQYGSPDVLHLETVDRPKPGPKEVLLRVRASSVNPMDYHLLHGAPIIRLFSGWRAPRQPIRGADVAGVVEDVGTQVTRFHRGDAVFGTCRGAFAEAACAPESSLAMLPGGVPFEHAAAAPIAGLTALQGLRDHGHLQSGQTVLIHGAAGGVGSFATQIARILGAHVTAVTSRANLDFVRALGADAALDYAHEDFTQQGRRYDLIFDCYANHSLADCRRALEPDGIYIGAGGPMPGMLRLLAGILGRKVLSHFSRQKFPFFVAKVNATDLSLLAGWIACGQLTPVLDQCYSLEKVPEALRYLETGHARGKVIIVVVAGSEGSGNGSAGDRRPD